LNSLLARLLLALAYPWLAHAATTQSSGVLAAVALGDIVLILLLEPLLRRRPWAFALLLASVPALWALSRSPYALLPLLLVPVAFIALVAASFARTLRPGRTPLISGIVAALEGRPGPDLEPEILAYTRRLTAVWAGALALLAAVNLVLALVAVPRGLLATFGVAAPFSVTEAQWSWFANWLDYGLVGGLFVVEYFVRKHRFPGRYHSLADFLRRMAALGPQFWRTLLR
jgi:uncharacterized membrane protein